MAGKAKNKKGVKKAAPKSSPGKMPPRPTGRSKATGIPIR